MEKRYEILTWTLCDGWINTWSVTEEIGDTIVTEVPETFATREQAQQALDEFLFDIQSEIDAGQRSADEGYDADDFRVAEVQPNAQGRAP
jgi:hypothetical protein